MLSQTALKSPPLTKTYTLFKLNTWKSDSEKTHWGINKMLNFQCADKLTKNAPFDKQININDF